MGGDTYIIFSNCVLMKALNLGFRGNQSSVPYTKNVFFLPYTSVIKIHPLVLEKSAVMAFRNTSKELVGNGTTLFSIRG